MIERKEKVVSYMSYENLTHIRRIKIYYLFLSLRIKRKKMTYIIKYLNISLVFYVLLKIFLMS